MSSHRARTAETRGMPVGTIDASNIQQKKPSRPGAENHTTRLPQRTSITSVGSSGRRSSSSFETSSKSSQTRPSALPRSTSSGSQKRVSLVASTRPALVSSNTKTSNISAASSSDPHRDVVRVDNSRMYNMKDPYRGLGPRTQSPMDLLDETSMTSHSPPEKPSRGHAPLPPRLIPELQALAASSYRNPPPSSSISSISSPSTQLTTSPSPWSASTAATTPTSWSSTSPCVIQQAISATSSKRSQTVPIPASLRTKLPKLPVLKESQSSLTSSLNTDVKPESTPARKKLKKTPINSPAPTPPPRSSSVKDSRSRSNSKSSVQERIETPKDLPPVPSTSNGSPPHRIARSHGAHAPATQLDLGHSRLQAAIHGSSQSISRDQSRPSTRSGKDQEKSKMSLDTGRQNKLMDAAPIIQSQHRRGTSQEAQKAVPIPENSLTKSSARSRLAKFSKLALFGRSKEPTEPDATSTKLQRKGPVAGTGHEGYGKFGRKTRKASISSNVTATESDTSVVSTKHQQHRRRHSNRRESASQSDLDDFAASRMKPVVLLGGSMREQNIRRPESQPEYPKALPVEDASSYTATSHVIHGALDFDLDLPTSNTKDSQRPTLALRRSQKFGDGEEEFHLPTPINTRNLVAPAYIDSQNTISSEIPTSAAPSETTSDLNRMNTQLADRQQKKARKLNWNPFRRKESIDLPTPVMAPSAGRSPEMQVSISTVAGSRSMPYYAMLESEPEITTTEAIGLYLNEAAQSPKLRQDSDADQSADDVDSLQDPVGSTVQPVIPKAQPVNLDSIPIPTQSIRHKLSDLEFPLPPERPNTATEAKPAVQQPDQTKPRQPRLAQVGRIPKVIRGAQPSALPKPELFIQKPSQILQESKKRSPVKDQKVENTLNRQNLAPRQEFRPVRALSPVEETKSDVSAKNSANPSPEGIEEPQDEFLKFVDPRSSDFTISSSSDGIISIMGPPPAPPPVRIRQSEYMTPDDEIWKEYDDFIDRVISPPSLRKMDKGFGGITGRERTGKTNAKGLAIVPAPLHHSLYPGNSLPTPPLLYEPSPNLQPMPSSEEIRLRRSQIAAALHASYASFDPSSPFSMREFIAEYGKRDSTKMSGRFSDSTFENRSPVIDTFQEASSNQTFDKQYESAAHIDDVERVKNPEKHSELSYASLMVSRWLSFGRVLVSPAHKEVESTPERHILVIDGLGNEDWSIYCAVTYQAEKAYVHDLKEKRPTRRGSQASKKTDVAPANHRRAEVASFNDRFPFPPSFFTAIIFRFPPTMPDAKLKNIMSECKRVLTPGGYLELMVLELDIVNMGTLTRRAVKDLKIKMSTLNREVSLKPITDNVQSILGSRGFSNVTKCMVGVPVVGRPVSSTGSSTSSRSSGGSIQRSSAGPKPFGGLTVQEGFSLNDLVADHSENADAKIGRVVSRTARSWWQHCFEASTIANGNLSKSVFANKEVLRECKSRASSFKLLIAYTQKPHIEQKRRTLSEPTVTTLATAGGPRNPRSGKPTP